MTDRQLTLHAAAQRRWRTRNPEAYRAIYTHYNHSPKASLVTARYELTPARKMLKSMRCMTAKYRLENRLRMQRCG